ncbi:MAG: HAD family phosphatase [Bacteroidetes bacterium]|jgi:Cof subfamily protein (haloacid dehalogenase superfamily)|nr:HAD family phosphatase [Bacteroidota bacterium]
MMKGIVATDLDGTLFNSSNKISKTDLKTLNYLKYNGFVRVIATGRSMYSLNKATSANLPIDYVVFSSGAGVYDWKQKKVIYSTNLSPDETKMSFEKLVQYQIDFSIQNKIPENHRYEYLKKKHNSNPDFERRNQLYTNFSSEITVDEFVAKESCQLLAITEKEKGLKMIEELSLSLSDLKIIRSTSPIDNKSLWIEIFSKNVSKASGLDYLANLLNIDSKKVMAIGNDYNDIDMLKWAEKSFVVENAPVDIKRNFKVVGSHNNSGFSEAVEIWLISNSLI